MRSLQGLSTRLACLLLLAWPSFSVGQDYALGEGDVLRLTVYGHADLTTVQRVDADGTIRFPLVGEVEVGGLTASQVSERTAALLADGYIVNPQVSVFVEEFRTNRVVVTGGINRPGLYEFRGRITFYELLSRAGGLSKDAGDRATVKRGPSIQATEAEVVAVDLGRPAKNAQSAMDVPIFDGDSVYIEESRSSNVVITGQVKRPGVHQLRGHATFLQLLSKAGGLTEDAGDSANITRKRTHPEAQETVITVDLKRLVEKGETSIDVPIVDGDSVYVTKAGVFYVTGEVKKAGAYKLQEDTTVLKAVTVAGGFTGKAARGKVRIVRKIEGNERVLRDVKMVESVLPDDVIVVPESFF
jgi:polysaccharide export outer membrane protein